MLSRLPSGIDVPDKAYRTADKITKELEEYVGEWLRYQALWDLQAEVRTLKFMVLLQIFLNLQMLYDRLGSDLSKWMRTVAELRKSRTIFDTQV